MNNFRGKLELSRRRDLKDQLLTTGSFEALIPFLHVFMNKGQTPRPARVSAVLAVTTTAH